MCVNDIFCTTFREKVMFIFLGDVKDKSMSSVCRKMFILSSNYQENIYDALNPHGQGEGESNLF